MTALAALFLILLAACCIYSFLVGGGEARLACGMLAAAVLITRAVTGHTHDQLPLALVDLSLLVGLLGIAMRSRHYWPMWSASFHGVTLAAHAAIALAPPVDFRLMAGVTSLWSLFTLVVMPLGIMLDHLAGIHGSHLSPKRAPS